MLIVIIDLTSKVSPSEAVAALEGDRFKRTENRMKRYTNGGAIAEAVHAGVLKIMTITPVTAIDESMLVDRRWMTMMDFPWSTRMDTETPLLQHVTLVTHRVSVVCETGLSTGAKSVRIEWEFAAGKDEDDCERVDWIMERMGVRTSVSASLTLKRLLRQAKLKDGHGIEGDGEGREKGIEIRRQDEGISEDLGNGESASQDKCEQGGPSRRAGEEGRPRPMEGQTEWIQEA